MGCIFDEPLEPYICEADWNCKDCPNWVEDKEVEDGNKLSKSYVKNMP